MDTIPIRLNGREVKPHKAIVNPLLNSKTVLTNTPWDFVELWLQKEKENTALFYWKQAREFNKASQGLPTQSAPLLHYYSFMNAVKALLSAKRIAFDEYHGVRGHKMRGVSPKISITNEGVRILTKGILPALSGYLGETETSNLHSLKELLFNLPYIHRTYCLTFPSQTEMYIPLKNCQYVIDKSSMKAFFTARLSSDFSYTGILRRLPPSFTCDSTSSGEYIVRSKAAIIFSTLNDPTSADLANLAVLHRGLRNDLFYINGTQTLWYIKAVIPGPSRLARFPTTITLAAMHRLSEICRYRPLELNSFLKGQRNWLLTEFINQSPLQFFDEIAAEITGHQFLTPNVRPAS